MKELNGKWNKGTVVTIMTAAALGWGFLAGDAPSARAAVIVTTDNQLTDDKFGTYTVSSTDLIEGLTPSASSGEFDRENTGGLPVLNDGFFPSDMTWDDPDYAKDGFAEILSSSSVTYTLAVASDIGRISVYGGWVNAGRDDQRFEVYYATTADPETFIQLGQQVYFGPDNPDDQYNATRVTLTDNTGTLAANVQSIRFDFPNQENTAGGYAEIDVLPVPEPATLGLVLLGGVTLLRRRRMMLEHR